MACLHFVNCIVQYLIYLRRQERRKPKLLPNSCDEISWLVVRIHKDQKSCYTSLTAAQSNKFSSIS